MTVAISTSRIQYNCNGSVVAFAFGFGVGATDEIQVILTDSAGVETTLTETTHYVISATNDDYESGGTVTTVATYAAGNTITILRDVPVTQESDFTENMPTLYETFEDGLDKLTRINQQQDEEIERTIKLKKSYDPALYDLEINPVASRAIGFDAVGTALTTYETTTILDANFDSIQNYSNNLSTAVTAIGGASKTLIIDVATSLSGNTTVPSTLNLMMLKSGLITIETGVTLTISGPFSAGLYQVFSGTGLVVLGDLIYTAYPEWWGIDGILDEVQINQAITALTSGTVLLGPSYITAATINMKTKVNLTGLSGGDSATTAITYPGSGSVIEFSGISGSLLENVYVVTTHDDANGIKAGNTCRRINIENVLASGTGTLTNTGAAFLLAAETGWSGGISIKDSYGIGYKYGVLMTGVNINTDTWTTVDMTNLWLVGRSAGAVVGGAGIYMDAKTNGIGTYLRGGTIESFNYGVYVENGGYGGEFVCDMEGNTILYTVGLSFNGTIRIPASNEYYNSGSNGIANIWYKEKNLNGTWLSESYYNKLHNILEGVSNVLRWGVTRGASEIDGGSPTDKFVVTLGGVADVAPQNNNIKLLTNKIAYSNVVPAAGAWVKGDVVFNTQTSTVTPVLWSCVNSGTPGVWIGLVPTSFNASGSWTPGSISAGATVTTTISIGGYGFNIGDFVMVGPPSLPAAGLILQAYWSASTVCTLSLTNITAGALTGPDGTYNIQAQMY